MVEQKPSDIYREKILEIFDFDRDQFQNQFESEYIAMKKELSDLMSSEGSPDKIEATRVGVYFFAVGLFICGRLEMVDDILDNVLVVPKGIRPLVASVKDLLPLEVPFRKETDIEKVKAWFQENRERLVWDEELGKFVFEQEAK